MKENQPINFRQSLWGNPKPNVTLIFEEPIEDSYHPPPLGNIVITPLGKNLYEYTLENERDMVAADCGRFLYFNVTNVYGTVILNTTLLVECKYIFNKVL